MNDVKAAVMTGRSAIEGRKDWGFDRSKYLNASEAGQCIRQLWYSKHTPEAATAQEWGYARRGSHAETYVVESLRATNSVDLQRAGEYQVSVQDEARRLSATPDGFIKFDDGSVLGLEVKSIDPRTNRSNLPKAEHVLQLQLAMGIANPTVKVGLLVYIDASNFDDIIQFEIPADPAALDRAAAKAKKVFNTKAVDSLDREGRRSKDGCQYCPFTATCGVDLADAPSRKRANRGSRFDIAAVRYMEIKDTEAALENEKKALAEDIKSELISRSVNKAVVGDIEVSLSITKGRASLDRKAVAAAGIDLSPFETTGAPSERLSVQRV